MNHAILALSFSLQESLVERANNRCCGMTRASENQANACCRWQNEPSLCTPISKFFLDLGSQLFSKLLGLVVIKARRQCNHFIPATSINFPDAPENHLKDPAIESNGLVTNCVAQRIIHGLEIIQVRFQSDQRFAWTQTRENSRQVPFPVSLIQYHTEWVHASPSSEQRVMSMHA